MVLNFPPALQNALDESKRDLFTGYISITGKEKGRDVYGSLAMVKGTIADANYGASTGAQALESLSELITLDVSMARSQVNLGSQLTEPQPTETRPNRANAGSEKRRFKLSIFPKILLIIFAVSLVPMAGLWYTSSVSAAQQAEKAVTTSLASASTLVSTKVTDWIDMNVRYLQHSATLPEMTSMTKQGHVLMMSSLIDSYEWMESSLTILPDGTHLTTDKGVTIPRSFSDRPLYQEISSGLPWSYEVLTSLITDRPVFALGVPIQRDGQFAGVWGMGLTISEVSEAVADTRVGATGYSFLVDAQGRVIAHGEPGQLSEDLQDFSAHPALLNAQAGEPYIYTNDEGVRKVAYLETLDALNLRLVVEQNYAEAYAPLISARRNAVALLIATLLIILTAAYVFARRLVTPLERLTKVAEAMSRGDINMDISGTERSDEIGDLARAVERMGMSIKVMFKKIRTN